MFSFPRGEGTLLRNTLFNLRPKLVPCGQGQVASNNLNSLLWPTTMQFGTSNK